MAGAVGELLLTAGAIVLLFVIYTCGAPESRPPPHRTIYVSNSAQAWADQAQAETIQGDDRAPIDELEFDDAYGIMRIPRFGGVMVEGVEDEDLKNGPGHYPDSADPGELRDFSLAAHRSGHGEPLAQIDKLYVGDIVEVETVDGTFVYELDSAPNGDPDGNKIAISDTWVVDPVPGEPEDTQPTERRITLTTCWPRWGSSARMYATGVLVSAERR